MFSVNDYVLYGSEGVCKVEDIGNPDISGLDKNKQYYTLMPIHRSGKIYTPTDSTIMMRSVITKSGAKELLARFKSIDSKLDVPRDAKQAMQYYKCLVRTYECEKLISIIKYVFKKQSDLNLIKKNVPAVDLKFMKIAEDMLCSELAFALECDQKEVKSELTKLCADSEEALAANM